MYFYTSKTAPSTNKVKLHADAIVNDASLVVVDVDVELRMYCVLVAPLSVHTSKVA